MLYRVLLLVAIYMVVVEGGGLRAHRPNSERGFHNIPVRRAEEHARAVHQRDLRLARHREQLETYSRNQLDESKMASHHALLRSAQEMEQRALRKRADAASGGSTPMVDYYNLGTDIGYACNLSIGTPAQVFAMVPDTGSSDLWVPGNTVSDPGHNQFNPSSSSSYQSTSDVFADSYGAGEASGQVGRDVVQMAGFTVQNKTFGVATKLDSQFQQQENDGLIGMANSILANMSAYTFFEDLVNQKQIDNPYFSVFLSRGRQYTTATDALVAGSSLCLGCMASPVNVQTSGSMFYASITLFAFYEVQVSSISLNGQSIGSTSHLAIVDTGTTALYLPSTVAAAMMAPVNGQVQRDGSYIVPVSAITTSTQFTFNFGNGSININPLDLISGYADSARQTYLLNVFAADTQDPKGQPISILGDVFIKNALTVFSYSQNGSPAVGFQQLNANSQEDTTSVPVITQTAQQATVTTGTLRRTRTSAGFTFTSGVTGTARSSAGRGAVPFGGGGVGALTGVVGAMICVVFGVGMRLVM